jgi:hypothetical protein
MVLVTDEVRWNIFSSSGFTLRFPRFGVKDGKVLKMIFLFFLKKKEKVFFIQYYPASDQLKANTTTDGRFVKVAGHLRSPSPHPLQIAPLSGIELNSLGTVISAS